MTIQKSGSATWEGSIKEGKGTVSLESGAMENNPFGFNTRFEGKPGTNPEELIAGAHASCFSMALSKVLGDSDMTPDHIDTKATVTLVQEDSGFTVTKSHLELNLKVLEASEDDMKEAAETAKANCPISKLLNAEITLEATYSS